VVGCGDVSDVVACEVEFGLHENPFLVYGAFGLEALNSAFLGGPVGCLEAAKVLLAVQSPAIQEEVLHGEEGLAFLAVSEVGVISKLLDEHGDVVHFHWLSFLFL
jgi:hypothetical protein